MKSKSDEKVMKKLLVHRSPCCRYYKNMLLQAYLCRPLLYVTYFYNIF